jgi:hypothetical protein
MIPRRTFIFFRRGIPEFGRKGRRVAIVIPIPPHKKETPLVGGVSQGIEPLYECLMTYEVIH